MALEMLDWMPEDLRRHAFECAFFKGARVWHRSKECDYDEKHANFLFDVTIDPSTGLQLGQKVTITGELAPAIIGRRKQLEGMDVSYSNMLFRIAGFVDVVCKVGKMCMTHRYCSLISFAVGGDDKGFVMRDVNGKVKLFWTGSLRPLSWEIKQVR